MAQDLIGWVYDLYQGFPHYRHALWDRGRNHRAQ